MAKVSAVTLFLCVATAASATAQRRIVLGAFDETVSPGTSLVLGNLVSEARMALQASFPAIRLVTTSVITPAVLASVDIFVLTSATGASTAISRALTIAEQGALTDFVIAGGSLLVMADNATFHPSAPVVHASFLTPFGLGVTGTLPSFNAHVPNPAAHAVTAGPFGSLQAAPLPSFYLIVPGYFDILGTALPLAFNNANQGQAVLAVLRPGDTIPAGPIQGRVVFVSDVGVFVNSLGGPIFSQVDNTALFLNSIAWLAGAAFESYGTGCHGLSMGLSQRPALGADPHFQVSGYPYPGTLLVATALGFAQYDPGVSLANYGAPGCELYTSLDSSSVGVVSGPMVSVAAFPGGIPSLTALIGIALFSQAASLSPGINQFGAITSNGLTLVCGTR